MMRSGYDLPPINFTTSEVEAIVVGLNMLGRTGDQELHRAAQSVASKIESVREKMDSLQTSSWGAAAPDNVDPALLRTSIRNEQKLRLVYSDDKQCVTRRTVLPIAVVYYIEVIVLVAWCELRKSFRHFRVDRMSSCEPLQKYFRRSGAKLRQQWQQENDVD
jgi:predicted DNA-binding transcriptional regulator YafY